RSQRFRDRDVRARAAASEEPLADRLADRAGAPPRRMGRSAGAAGGRARARGPAGCGGDRRALKTKGRTAPRPPPPPPPPPPCPAAGHWGGTAEAAAPDAAHELDAPFAPALRLQLSGLALEDDVLRLASRPAVRLLAWNRARNSHVVHMGGSLEM